MVSGELTPCERMMKEPMDLWLFTVMHSIPARSGDSMTRRIVPMGGNFENGAVRAGIHFVSERDRI